MFPITFTSPTKTIDGMITSTTSLLNTSTQSCSTFADNNQEISIQCLPEPPGCKNIDISHVDFSQFANIKVSCVISEVSKNNQNFKNISSTSASSLINGMNITDQVKQDTVIHLCDNIVNSVVDSFVQNCSLTAVNNQKINVIGRAGNINITYIDFKQYIDAATKCSMKSTAVIDAKKQLYQVLGVQMPPDNDDTDGGNNDSNNSTLQFLKNYGFFIVIGIVLLSGLFFTKFKLMTNPIFLPGIVTTISLYLIWQYYNNQDWPYVADDDDTNKKIFIGSLSGLGIAVLLCIIFVIFNKKK